MAINNLKFVLPCHFGLESVLKREVRKLNLEIDNVFDGEVRVIGNLKDISRLNLNIKTAERVLIEVGQFEAKTFDDLYNGIYNLSFEDFIPVNGFFPITKANQDKNSILHSQSAIQSITKKAIVERLKKVYKTNELLEDFSKYPIRVKFNKNIASIRLDTTGDSLHKRGYRIKSGLAPIEETLAAALIFLTNKNNDEIFIDPFCGSGTFAIEKALISSNIPILINRAFLFESWGNLIDCIKYEDAVEEVKKYINYDYIEKHKNNPNIYAYDIDENMINIAKENAKRAGVEDLIIFKTSSIKQLSKELNSTEGIILTNPPYGERLNNKNELYPIYESLYLLYKNNNFDLNVITNYDEITRIFGREDKNRKIYNGMLKTYLYTYKKLFKGE